MMEITWNKFWSIMRRSIKGLHLSPRRLMNATSGRPPWRCVLLMIVALAWVEDVARGGLFFPGGDDHLVVDKDNDTIYVGNSEETDCFYRLKIEGLFKNITHAKLGWVYERGKPNKPGVYLVYGEDLVISAAKSNFDKVDLFGNPCPEKSSALDSPTFAGADPKYDTIVVSNDGDVLDITCDGRFAIVVGANSKTPVSLVDLKKQKEVDTFAYDGLARSVAACDDGQSVLVVFDSNDGTNSVIKRLTIAKTGNLKDTGEALTPSIGEFIRRVRAVPGSKSGVAVISNNSFTSARLVSFAIPGLQMLDSATLAQRQESAVAVSCAGDKVYVRSGGSGPDVIEGFSYDPVTGEISDTPSVTINNVSYVSLTVYENPMAVTPDGAWVLASGPAYFPTQEVPTPRVTAFDATTGERLNAFTYDGLTDPGTIDGESCCAANPCELKSMIPSESALELMVKESHVVTVKLTGDDDCPVEGTKVKAKIDKAGKKRISVSPKSSTSDSGGEVTFTIKAKQVTGMATVTFTAGSIKEYIVVEVKK